MMNGQQPNEQVVNEAQEVCQQQEQVQQNVQQQQKSYMLVFNEHFNSWMLHEYFTNYFNGQLHLISRLRQTVNQKWTQQQVGWYFQFMRVVEQYIIKNVYSLQVQFFEDYQDAAFSYAENQNPIGFQLFNKQIEYLIIGQMGHKEGLKYLKEMKGIKRDKPEPVKKQVKQAPRQKKITRQPDPQINLEKLFSKKWAQKYLNADVLTKQNANIVFIGHVDSGKSTLTGNILKQLKEVDDQQILRNKQDAKENKMEAWEGAGLTDIIPEERQDGKTREFAKVNFTTEKRRYTLIDAPGHRNYVPNMIMGACQADIALLIISAKEGEFESGFQKDGQTKEHAMLAKALGVHELIVGVTKMQLTDWSQKRFNYIKEQVNPFLQGGCGFHNVVFLPMDSIASVNIHKRVQSSWYYGPSLIEYFDQIKLPKRNPTGPLRMPIIDKFKQLGNLFLYGKIQSGTIIEDHPVTVMPSQDCFMIKQIYNAKDQLMPFAIAGENVKLKVKNINEDQVFRGDIICNNRDYCQESMEFKAKLTILELPEGKKVCASGYQCVMHMHAIAEQVVIEKIDARIDKHSGKKLVSTFLCAGQSGIGVIKSQRPICLEKVEFMPSLGRFTLRDEGKTMGYGQVLGIKPAKKLMKQQEEHLMKKKVVGEENLEHEVQKMKIKE